LNEYEFRLNRRFYQIGRFNSVPGIATDVAAPTCPPLYDGK
jgi:hypothetical protein